MLGLLLSTLLALLPALALACSPPLQHFTGQPPALFAKRVKNVLIIGDSISMGGDPHSDPLTFKGSPGGYGNYVLKLLTGHNILSVQHNGGAYNKSKATAGDQQAGNTDHILDCLDYWCEFCSHFCLTFALTFASFTLTQHRIGKNSSHPKGLPWDAIHFNSVRILSGLYPDFFNNKI